MVPQKVSNDQLLPAKTAYPQRPQFFAMQCLRLFIASGALCDLGAKAYALLSIVVLLEDAKRYSSPPTFFNGQLQQLVGIAKWDNLDAIRKALIAAGWLVYIPPPSGQRGVPGKYWATIPAGLQGRAGELLGEQNHPPKTDTVADSPSPENGYGSGEAYPNLGDGQPEPYPEAYPKKGALPYPTNPNSLSPSAANRKFQLAGRWDMPEVHQAFANWATHYESMNSGERYSDIMADAMCQDAARRGWSPVDLVENITHSIAVGSRKTIIDRNHRPAQQQSGRAPRPRALRPTSVPEYKPRPVARGHDKPSPKALTSLRAIPGSPATTARMTCHSDSVSE